MDAVAVMRPSGVLFVYKDMTAFLDLHPAGASAGASHTSSGRVATMSADVASAWADTRAQLVAFVARRVEDRETAEDLVQDILERLLRAEIDNVASVQAWLYRAARNAIIDHYRRRRPTIGLDDDQVPEPVVEGPDESQPTAAAELAVCLRPLIDQLPADYRDAITLVDLDGHTQNAAAVLAGLSTSGMKSRVQRGRRQLAQLLGECCTIETNHMGSVVDYRPAEPCDCPSLTE